MAAVKALQSLTIPVDGSTVAEAIVADHEALLGRIDSSESLLAIADGSPTPAALLGAAADSEAAARDTFAAWVDDEDDPEVRTTFASVVEQERDHYARVTAELDAHEPPAAPGPLHASLRARYDTIERIAAGPIGRTLVSVRTHRQLIGFFDDRGDPGRAALFRDLRDETESLQVEGCSLLDDRCDDADWTTARAAASYTIEVAADALDIHPEP